MQGGKQRVYVDFEPNSEWVKGKEVDTIELHVQGFRKDQLRVQINSLNTLLVTGERQLEDKISWSRFSREFKLTREYCLNSIRAKLRNGILHIIVPRKLEARRPGDEWVWWMKDACWRLQFVSRRRVLQVSVAVLAAAAIGIGTYLASKYLFNHGRDDGNGSTMPGPAQYIAAVANK
ncbi:hypothetical protein SAY86_010608 [Trapa natans]|uniref:SHSP domain-containing protein n=1 Tax=Trapa natans TaxID=22666 RepID=A0AAN7LSK1_TRANT|nr:hypothetical protein SAY86_010608 [Trapa natans]